MEGGSWLQENPPCLAVRRGKDTSPSPQVMEESFWDSRDLPPLCASGPRQCPHTGPGITGESGDWPQLPILSTPTLTTCPGQSALLSIYPINTH
jgi:hypothetical protein